MKKFFANLVTLPYRAWMLGLGHMCWCDECHTIVSGGFGQIYKGKHSFSCMDCAHKEFMNNTYRSYLNEAMGRDPTNNEE